MPTPYKIPNIFFEYANRQSIDIEKEKHNPEFWKMVHDYYHLPEIYEFSYKHYKCVIERMSYGFFLRVYIYGLMPDNFFEIDNVVHGGITRFYPDMLEFDFAHAEDYHLNDFVVGVDFATYKDKKYAQINCEEIIDTIIKLF